MANLNVQLKNKNGDILYPKTKASNLINDINLVTSTEMMAAIANAGKLSKQIVDVLPTEDISLDTIYMLPVESSNSSSDSTSVNRYLEYMYINSNWEVIGSSDVNLSDYYTKSEIDSLLSSKANTNDVYTSGQVDTLLSAKAPLNSPAFTGTPTCPTPSGDTGIANKSYVDTQVSGASGTILYDIIE